MEKRSNYEIAENRTFVLLGVVRHKSDQYIVWHLKLSSPCKSFTAKSLNSMKNQTKNLSVLPTPLPNSRNFSQCRWKHSVEN